MKGIKLLQWLWVASPLTVASAVQGQSVTVGYAQCMAVPNYSQSIMNQIGQLRWYFAHASVGECIMEGVTNLHLSNSSFYQLQGFSASSSPPASTQAGYIYEDDRGNPVYYGDYQVKLNLFQTAVENGWHYPTVNIAVTKFCFIDIWTTTNASAVSTLLNSYLSTMTSLESAYPQTLFVYATMPLTTTGYSYSDIDSEPFDLYWRNVFNNSLRSWCNANGRVLFDIADIESHDSNGNPITVTYNGLACEELWSGDNQGGDQCCGEVGDNAHPTNLGAEELLARGFYALAAATVNRWGAGATNGTFQLSASPTSQSIQAGGAGVSFAVSNQISGSFAGPVTLGVAGLPGGARATFNPPSISGAGASTLAVTAAATTAPGNYSITITGAASGMTNTAPVALVVTGVIPPVANNDNFTLTPNTALTIPAPGVLANDTDGNGYPLSSVLVSGPANGSLNLSANGGFTYTPNSNFSGTDSFTYQATDGVTNSAPATVSLSADGILVQGRPLTIAYTDCVAVANYPQALMNQLPQFKCYFAHASVGELMMEGMTNLSLQAPGFYQMESYSCTGTPPPGPLAGGIWNDDRGNQSANDYYGDFQFKVNYFQNAVSNGWHYPLVNAVMNKFGFPDIWYNDNSNGVASLLNLYLNSMTNLEAAFPQTLFIYATMTITTTNYSYLVDVEPADEYWRDVFNDGLRAWCQANNRVLFDVADMEAHDTNGDLSTFLYNGQLWEQMWPGDTVGGDACCGEVGDGGHPSNFEAEKVLARGFYALAAATASRWNPGSTNSFYLVATPPTQSVRAGGPSVTYSISYQPSGSFGSPVALSLSGLPAGASASLNPTSIGSGASSALTVTVADTIAPGNYTLSIRGVGGGVTNSTGVTFTVQNTAPVANDDSYSFTANTTLTVAAPGVLANDSDANGYPLMAVLASGPANGTVNLNTNGGFTYTPNPDFSGTDGFTYQATDGIADSTPATVTLFDAGNVLLFSDDFTRATDPAPIAPWIAEAGAWTITAGQLQGIGPAQTYGSVYVTNLGTNYSAQARLRFSATNAYGAGVAGRLNPASGARYAAWLYPDGSPSGPALNLIKFQDWTSWSYQGASFKPMARTALTGVGTNWHTVELFCQSNRLAVLYDGRQAFTVTDAEPSPYYNGGVGLDMFTGSTLYTFAVDSVMVNALTPSNSVVTNLPPLVIGSITVSGATAVIGWNSSAGHIYRLQYKNNLADAAWTDVQPDVSAAGTTATVTNVFGEDTARFYRVLVVQ